MAIIILVIIVAVSICIAMPQLEKQKYREYNPVALSSTLKQEREANTINLTAYDIIKYSNKKTNELLRFSTKCEPFDDRKVTKMHCVGFARVYSTICNYAFKVNHINGRAIPVVGIVKWNGINLNSFSKYLPQKWNNFTKDHDFVEVNYDNYTFYVDPTLNIINQAKFKTKKDVWKVMAHEFTHGYFSQGHCKANDPHCIMQDANKKPNFRIKSSLCDVCMEEVRSKLK